MNQLDEFGILRDHRIDPLELPVGLHQTGQRLDGLVKGGSLCYDLFAHFCSLWYGRNLIRY